MLTCAICGAENPKYSLPLTKEDGKWVVKPICGKCRRLLHGEAEAVGKVIRTYDLEGSLREASWRNAEMGKITPFLEAFARTTNGSVRNNGNKKKFAGASR
ncbi:MAG: hypothetical protein V1877_00890 [Candidatus Tagabacteria bacterium]